MHAYLVRPQDRAYDITQEIRAELVDPPDPWVLAEHLGIPVIPVANDDQGPSHGHFGTVEPSAVRGHRVLRHPPDHRAQQWRT